MDVFAAWGAPTRRALAITEFRSEAAAISVELAQVNEFWISCRLVLPTLMQVVLTFKLHRVKELYVTPAGMLKAKIADFINTPYY